MASEGGSAQETAALVLDNGSGMCARGTRGAARRGCARRSARAHTGARAFSPETETRAAAAGLWNGAPGSGSIGHAAHKKVQRPNDKPPQQLVGEVRPQHSLLQCHRGECEDGPQGWPEVRITDGSGMAQPMTGQL